MTHGRFGDFPLDPTVPVVAVEGLYGASDRHRNASLYTAGLVMGLKHFGVQSVLINPNEPADYDEKGWRRFGTVDGLQQQEFVSSEDHLVPDAWRLRRATLGTQEPTWLLPSAGYNSFDFRLATLTRKGVYGHLIEAGVGNLMLPSCLVTPHTWGQDLPPGEELFVKPVSIRETSPNPADHARLLSRAAAKQALNRDLLADCIVQPRVATHDPVLIAAASGAQLAPDTITAMRNTLHSIHIYDPLWRNRHNLPAFAWMQWKPAQPDQDGLLPPHSTTDLDVTRLLELLPALGHTHQQIWDSLKERFGPNNALALSYMITAQGRVVVQSILNSPQPPHHEAASFGPIITMEAKKLSKLAKAQFVAK